METKQITLRSQTVQCPHCGEYYSVTYKYCPFCDVGRQEEERRMAERKKQRQQKLGGLFGAEPDKKKKRPSGSAPRKEAPARRESPVHDFEDEAPAQSAPKKKESLFFSKPTRKKTSEMTEEEKKAFKAEREARAAERKRERDRLAREAALAAGEPDPIFDAADSYEAPTQETFEMAEVPVEAPEAVVLEEVAVAEPAPAAQEPAAVEVPAEAAPAAPAEPVPTEEVSAEEVPAEPAPMADEPTIVIPTAEVAEAVTEASIVDENPTQVLPVEEIQTLEAQAEAETPVVAAPIPETKEPTPKKQAPKKKKKSILPVILSLVLIVAAAFIVVKTLGPAFSDGLLSSQSADAETITLEQTELTFAEAGATVTLAPIFAPEGTSAPITWTTSDEAIATVDENGTVTAVAKGLATITATLENGQTAQCVVNCAWEDAPAQPAEGEAAEGEAAPAGPGLSASTLTLDSQGKTKQLQVTGVEGTVKWSSNKTDVATVAEDGTVTAVAKGGATITAEVGDQAFTCEVKCIW